MEMLNTICLHPKTPNGRPPPPPPPHTPAKLPQPSNNSGKILPDLPFDIQISIISRLPVRLIVACKSLSENFNEVISNPSFSHIYLSNNNNFSLINSSTLSTFFTHEPYQNIYLDLVEFERDVYIYNNNSRPHVIEHTCFTSSRLPRLLSQEGSSTNSCRPQMTYYSIWGHCNGLFVLLKLELGLINLFIANPISGEFIQLPEPLVDCNNTPMAYGLGYCQVTDRFKVLRIITSYLGGKNYENKSEILTIGIDKEWRSVSDVNVPYNIKPKVYVGANPQSYMVAYRSALHWFVQPIVVRSNWIKPKWGGKEYICAFNMTEEKVSALPFPPQRVQPSDGYGMGVLLDKLCLWELWMCTNYIDIWIMEEYGVEGSWAKRFSLKCPQLEFMHVRLMVLAISSNEEVMLISDHKKLIFYDMKVNKLLMNIPHTQKAFNPIPFVPNFVSFRNRQGWIVEV